MDALEAQSDMLEQTALQRQVASALGETAKTIKKEKGLLNQAESAVDSASEMRDLHEDISQVMAGLGDTWNTEFDEDALFEELNEMTIRESNKNSNPNAITLPPSVVESFDPTLDTVDQKDTTTTTSHAIPPIGHRLEFPNAPKGKPRIEQLGLLQHQ
jgi:flagellin-like hook-associated protein FlgL